VKGFRPRPNANPAENVADKASDLRGPVRREGQPEQQEQHRVRLSRVHPRTSSNVVASQLDDRVRKQIPRMVGRNRFRRRGKNADRSVSGSARRHPLAPLSTGNLTGVRHREFTSRSRLRLVQDMRMKRAPNEKEFRVLTLSRHRPTTSARNSSSNEAARLPQPITARDTGSRKVGIKGNPKKRHRRGRTNICRNNISGSRRSRSGAAFFAALIRTVACGVLSAEDHKNSAGDSETLQQFGDLNGVQRSAFEQLIA
jgi:hypothetical protein